MILAGLVFGSPNWQWVAWVSVAAAALLIAVGASAYRRGGAWSSLPLVCKSLAMLILAACLMEPLWSSVRTRAGANIFLVLADTSASLTIRDADAEMNRGEQLQDLLTGRDRSWMTRLEQEFDVRRFTVASRLESLADDRQLDFAQNHSAWFPAARRRCAPLHRRHRHRRAAQ
jgi:hypothetical protein